MSTLSPQRLDELEAAAQAMHELVGDHWPSADGWIKDAWSENAATYLAAMNPATILALIADTKEQQAAIERVRELHVPWPTDCGVCDNTYPCSTIQALDGTQETA